MFDNLTSWGNATMCTPEKVHIVRQVVIFVVKVTIFVSVGSYNFSNKSYEWRNYGVCTPKVMDGKVMFFVVKDITFCDEQKLIFFVMSKIFYFLW